MIRFLSIQPVAERGGSDQAQLDLIRQLAPNGFTCHVVVPAEPPLRAALEAAGATITIVPMRRISTSHSAIAWLQFCLYWPMAIMRLLRIIRRERIDLVHTNSMHSWYGWAAAWLARKRHIWHAREIVTQSSTALRLERFLMRHFATRVIAISNAVAAQLDPRNVTVTYDRPDPELFRAANEGSTRVACKIPDTAPLALMVGRLDTWKGFETLFEAWNLVYRARPDAYLGVIGLPVSDKAEYGAALLARVAQLPNAISLGAQRDMPSIYAAADLLVAPSTDPEPFGLVIAEALTVGLAVVATAHGGAAEILERCDASYARGVPPREVEALAQAIIALLPDQTNPTLRASRANRFPFGDPELASTFTAVVAES